MIPFSLAHDKERTAFLNGSEAMNMYAEVAQPGGTAQFVLQQTPGVSPFCTLPTAPVLALKAVKGRLFAATADAVYEVDEYGQHTKLGDCVLGGRVSVATNGMHVVFVDGKKGFSLTLSSNAVAEITDPNFYPADVVTFQDGYFIFNRAGTGQFFITDPYTLTFNALNFATAEGVPNNIISLISNHRELWIFGDDAIEVWFNAATQFPFQRVAGAVIGKGIAAAHSPALVDNTVFWLGKDGVVYRAEGYSPMRISTHPVEQDIGKGRQDDAFAYSYSEDGHLFYVLTFPHQKKTWVYDVAVGLWHKRSSAGYGRHLSECYEQAFNRHLVAQSGAGAILQMSRYTYHELGEQVRRHIITPPIHSDLNKLRMHSAQVVMDAYPNASMDKTITPWVMMSWSDDGGESWSTERWVSAGALGRSKFRATWRRLGRFRQRQIKFAYASKLPLTMVKAVAELERA